MRRAEGLLPDEFPPESIMIHISGIIFADNGAYMSHAKPSYFGPRTEGRFMKPITIVGIALILLGVVILVVPNITYTTEKNVVDIGPVEASAETEKSLPLPPIIGGVILAGGIVLVAVGAKKG
jgi:uncharacterized membrane protein